MSDDVSVEANDIRARELRLAEERAKSDRELKERELRLAEANANTARDFKEREFALADAQREQDKVFRTRELELKSRELSVGRWSGPAAVAVAAGVFGIAGTLFSSYQSRDIERKKQEGALILEAIKTGVGGREREQQAAANLVFLADANLVNLDKAALDKLRQRAGNTSPSLPSASSQTPGVIPESIRERILDSFEDFGKYLSSRGVTTAPKVLVELIPSGSPSAIAYYDPGTNKVYIDPQFLTEPNVALREYAHAVLYAGTRYSEVDFVTTWTYVGIESGLASYLAASFVDNPRIPGLDGKSLDNDRRLNELKSGSTILSEGLIAWGGAFWEMRKLVGRAMCDRILLAAWASLGASDIKNNDPIDFIRRVLDADSRLESGQHVKQILAMFSRRGIQLPPQAEH